MDNGLTKTADFVLRISSEEMSSWVACADIQGISLSEWLNLAAGCYIESCKMARQLEEALGREMGREGGVKAILRLSR